MTTLNFLDMINDILNNNGVVTNSSTLEKTILARANQSIKVGLDSVNNNFSNNLANSVVKSYRAKIIENVRIVKFWDEKDICRV